MNIAAFLNRPNITDYPLSKPDYFLSYKELSQEVEKLGGTFYIVRDISTYQGNGMFSTSWQYKENILQETGPVTVDVIYDKGEGSFISDGKVPVLNPDYISEICTNKWLMYEKFQPYCPKTWLISHQDELLPALHAVTTTIAVVKPIDGEEGHGVFIETPASLEKREYSYPILVQEFLDTSGGVPGVVEGLHDFRVAILNGEIIYSYYRTPPKGSYLANVSQGGKFSVIPESKIPQVAKDIAARIDQEFLSYPYRFYGIDFGFTQDGPKIIEMNSRLGLLPNYESDAFRTLKEKLAQTFMRMGK